MMSELQNLQAQLRPFWGRLMVLPSPVDQAELPSGLIVPINGMQGAERGVVYQSDIAYDEAYPGYDISTILPVGTVVYFKGGVRIGEYVFVTGQEIYAYEDR